LRRTFSRVSTVVFWIMENGQILHSKRPNAAQVLVLIEKLEHFIDSSEFIPATRFYRSHVFLALISKALTMARAICALVDSDFPGEAFGLSRSLIDIFLSVRYISNKDSETRAKTYVNYFAKTHERWTRIIERHFPEQINAPMPSFHDEAMEIAKEFKGHEWTGMRGQTKLMALEKDTHEVNAIGEPLTQDFDYEVIYPWTSQYVHVTIASLPAHETEPGTVFRIRSRIDLENNLGFNALFNTLIFLSKIFVCALRGMNADQPEERLAEVVDLAKLFAKSHS
jgi:hypothetical protein